MQRIERIIDIFSLPEKEYRLVGSTVKLVPSFAIAKAISVMSSTSTEDKIGFHLSSDESATHSRFWEIHCPIDPVQAFLALKLLRKCPSVEDDTLCACFYAMRPKIDDTARHYLNSLKESGFYNVEEYRSKLLSEKIDSVSFNKFIESLIRYDILTASYLEQIAV